MPKSSKSKTTDKDIKRPKQQAQANNRQRGEARRSSEGGRSDDAAAKRRESRRKQARRRRNRRIALLVCLIIVVLLAAGGYLYLRFRTFDSYTTTNALELSNSDDFIEITEFGSGYIKITENGVTYFDESGVIWSESYSMTQPVYDVCQGYAAVGDINQSEVYIYDENGLVSKTATQYLIIDLEVSQAGVIAVATDDMAANYIEVYDKDGGDLLTARSIFSSSGYLADITLSEDGTKLAAAFINVDLQDIESRVVFYDFAKGGEGSDVIVGGFNQYTDTVLTTVEFMSDSSVVAIGDNAISIYDFSDTPELVYEDLAMEWTIQSIFFGEKYIGFITEDDTDEFNYVYHVFNTSGKIIAEGGFDLSYTDVQFYGRNIVLNSSNVCQIYSFDGIRKFNSAFEENIENICPIGSTKLIYSTTSSTDFIKLK